MKRRVALIVACSAVLGLSACGGGSGGGNDSSSAPKVYDVAALSKTDTVVGTTGPEALANSIAATNYTLWLYDATKADFKGTKIDGPSTLTRNLNTLIPGWQQGVTGMKVGGKRTVIVPSSLGYGVQGFNAVPANSGLVFDIELTALTNIYDAPALVKIDKVVGSGAEVVATSTVTATYTLWLYDTTKPESKGNKVEGPAALTLPLSSLIAGWQQGVPGMKVGGKRTLIVPSSLGYGTQGSSSVPANSGLVFDIELTAFK